MEKLKIPRNLFSKFLHKNPLYVEDKNYLLSWDGTVAEVKTGFSDKVRVVVLGKKYYFETTKTFPFSNMNEIKSAVEMDMSAYSPFETKRFFIRKTDQTNETTTVNLWFVDEKISEVFQAHRPLLIIPETALLSLMDTGTAKIYTIHKDGKTLFVHVDTSGTVRSTISSRTESDLQSFRRIIGFGAQDCPASDIDGDEYLALLQATLRSVPLKSLLGFVNADFFPQALNKKQVKIIAATACFLFVAYMALAGFMPYFAAKRLQQEDRELSRNLSPLLEKQAAIESYSSKQRELAEMINNYTYKLPLLDLLHVVLPDGTRINQLTVSGNTVEMKGQVKKATELLSALSRAKGIRNAKFVSPVREDRKTGMENFSLTFIYEQEAISSK